MRPACKLLALVAALMMVVLLVTVNCAPPDANQPPIGETKLQRASQTIPKLFDFALYRKMFHKTYSGAIEMMVRAKYFMSRALRVFVSALRFSNGEQGYFLSINDLSDRVEKELDMMRNRALDRRYGSSGGSSEKSENEEEEEGETLDLEEFKSGQDSELLYKTFVEALETRKADPFYAGMLDKLNEMEQDQQADFDKIQRRRAHLAQVLTAYKGDSSRQDEIAESFGGLLNEGKRTKREVQGPYANAPVFTTRRKRRLPLEKLINLGDKELLGADVAKKIPLMPHSNNPNYQAPELVTHGMVDQQVPLEMLTMKKRRSKKSKNLLDKNRSKNPDLLVLNAKDIDSFLTDLKDKYSGVVQQQDDDEYQEEENGSAEKPDEVFIDLRDTNCFFLPRGQGRCGSCYAFAAISLMEYLYCRKTGQLVAFSEQYIIDCGKQYYGENIFGCQGGYCENVPQYIHNFGLELRSLYPYRVREDTCPYEMDYNLKKAGFIRTDVKKAWEVPVERFADVLKFSPIVLSIHLPRDFKEYGGGVHPNECVPTEEDDGQHHAVLLVGHGREDNEEYWLIRNSHSVGWGEGGYYKMSKKTKCIDDNLGWIFGTSDGKNLDLVVKPNHRHNEQIIQEHYFNTMGN